MILLFSCDDWEPDYCAPGDYKCNGNKVEWCDGSGYWLKQQDCGSIDGICYSGASNCYGYDVSCCK